MTEAAESPTCRLTDHVARSVFASLDQKCIHFVHSNLIDITWHDVVISAKEASVLQWA